MTGLSSGAGYRPSGPFHRAGSTFTTVPYTINFEFQSGDCGNFQSIAAYPPCASSLTAANLCRCSVIVRAAVVAEERAIVVLEERLVAALVATA
jgi:hypothetical protein